MAGPLAGIKVIEIARAAAGPMAGMIRGDMGAEVIKIQEFDDGGDAQVWGRVRRDGGRLLIARFFG